MPVLVETMGDISPELTKKADEIKEILDEMEESSSRTWTAGRKYLTSSQLVLKCKEPKNSTERMSGAHATPLVSLLI
ncbi:hypothetical protein B0H15DRAFT_818828 [Mycena belliarum]|uniref:Uncharacterized protein n=1 Tax=Mycena belliarum TaxID=1033014 RepID=A0AAD6UE43_9AGAR|nr:hypothetical protein B0H15DRAFT_818828 [Mycena belliae]